MLENSEPRLSQLTEPDVKDLTHENGANRLEILAAIASALWLIVVVILWIISAGNQNRADSSTTVLFLVLAIIPIIAVWTAVAYRRSTQSLRAELKQIRGTLGELVAGLNEQNRTDEKKTLFPLKKVAAEVPPQENEVQETEPAEAVAGKFKSNRDAARLLSSRMTSDPDYDQPSLALAPEINTFKAPIDPPDFIRALNFPETAEDREGFAALRRAMEDRQTAQLIQASQDILTLLSQNNIYMDDLQADRSRPEIWRQFAAGVRGREIAALGAVRDPSLLDLCSTRMKHDPVFRDAAHHFLRRFDKTIADFADRATDEDLTALGATRTARAFMLLGRVVGAFD